MVTAHALAEETRTLVNQLKAFAQKHSPSVKSHALIVVRNLKQALVKVLGMLERDELVYGEYPLD